MTHEHEKTAWIPTLYEPPQMGQQTIHVSVTACAKRFEEDMARLWRGCERVQIRRRRWWLWEEIIEGTVEVTSLSSVGDTGLSVEMRGTGPTRRWLVFRPWDWMVRQWQSIRRR
jgi:hypothetical protein